MTKTPLSVLTLLYKREFVLPAIFQNLVDLRAALPHLDVTWHLALSPRVSLDVLDTINKLQHLQVDHRLGPRIEVYPAPLNPLDDKERFMELRQWQLSFAPPGWAVLWDDDQVLANPSEFAQHFHSDVDLLYATKVFFWDSDDQVATHLPPHRSVFFFRRRDGDQFPLGRTIHAPVDVHDNPRGVADLRGALLDYGYMRRDDRLRCWNEYKRVGKIDAATLALVREDPPLERWSGPFPLRQHAIDLKPRNP